MFGHGFPVGEPDFWVGAGVVGVVGVVDADGVLVVLPEVVL
jgi:hypothetical protein